MSGHQRLVRTATALGVAGLAVGAVATLARSVDRVPGVAPDTWAMATAFTDYGVLAYAAGLAGLVLAVALRPGVLRGLAVLVAVLLAALHLSWVVPAYVPDDRPVAGEARLRLLAQNMLLGGAQPEQLVQAAQDVDVLVLTEITSGAVDGLAAAGIGRHHPYEAGGTVPSAGAAGTRIYSRYPLRDSRILDASLGHEDWRATVAVPGLGDVTVAAVHPPRPVRGGSGWAGAQEALRRQVPRTRTVVAGDFNAVDSHPSLRRFRRDGFRDSDELVGAGWRPTYPAQGRIPPLIGIDHVLLSPELTATDFRTLEVEGTDHRGVVATIALRG